MNEIYPKFISIFLLVIISSFFSCCLNTDNNKEEEVIEVKYELLIEPIKNLDSNYIVICPIFVNKNGEASHINNQFILKEGNCEYNIKETSQGYGLLISSNQSILLGLYQTINSDEYDFILNFFNTSKGYGWGTQYFIYYEDNSSNPVKININIEINETYGDIIFEIDEYLKYGWNEYNAKLDISGD